MKNLKKARKWNPINKYGESFAVVAPDNGQKGTCKTGRA